MDLLESLAIYVALWFALIFVVYSIKKDAIRGFVFIMWRSERVAEAVRRISERLSFVPLKVYLIVAIALFVLTYLPLPIPIGDDVLWIPSYVLILFGSIGGAVSKAASGAPIEEVASTGGQAAVVPVLPGVTIPWGLLPYIAAAAAVGIALHEFAHGYAAARHKIKLKSAGVFSAFFIASGAFVEPDEQEFKKVPLSAKAAVLTSGVAANAALALITLTVLAVVIRLMTPSPELIENPFIKFIVWLYVVNMGLAAFNALPIYPLDGGLLFAALLGKVVGEKRALAATYVVSLALFALIATSTMLALMSDIYWQMIKALE